MQNITFIPGQLKTFHKYNLNKGLQKLLNLSNENGNTNQLMQ